MSFETMLYASLIIFFAYLVYGLTGFGSGLVAVPLLAHFMELRFIVPYILILNMAATLGLLGGRNSRRQVDWRELLTVLPFGVVGIVLGTFLLLKLPKFALLAALGGFVLVFGIRSLAGLRGDSPISRLWAIPAGISGGMAGALFNTSGPPYIIYLTHRLHDKSALRSSFSALVFVESMVRLAVFLVAGLLLQAHLITLLLLSLPMMVLGLYIGNRIHVGLTQAQMLKFVGLLLCASGCMLIMKSEFWARLL